MRKHAEAALRGGLVYSGAELNYYFDHGSKRRLGARFSFLPALGLLPLTAGLRLAGYTILRPHRILLTSSTCVIGAS